MMRWFVLALGAQACGSATSSIRRVPYADGKPHFEYEEKDGVPNGAGRTWNPNGSLKSEGTYVDGVKQGRFRFNDEAGGFEHQALFWNDVEVWRSSDPTAEPSDELVTGLGVYTREPHRMEPEGRTFEISKDPVPAPYFSTLERATALNRLGVDVGTGATRRMEVFANYALTSFGAYGRFLETDLDGANDMTIGGRRTLELGGTWRDEIEGIGSLTPHAGLVLPLGNDDRDGFIASSAGAIVRPSDVVASFPSTTAMRTGASLTHQRSGIVAQVDGGIDWLFAGQQHPFDAVAHANIGVGVGVRAAMLGVELSNAVLVSDPSRHVDAVALTGTVWFVGSYLTTALSRAFSGASLVTVGVGYEL